MISPFAFSNIKVAIIDTGFCKDHDLAPIFNSITNFDATGVVGVLNCEKNFYQLPRFHGENVLSVIANNIKIENKIDLYLISVFDKKGNQDLKYWKNAIQYVIGNKIDLVVSAVGIPLKGNINIPQIPLNSGWIISAARISPGIKKNDSIFPQMSANGKNVILVGDYLDQNKKDYALLNTDLIKVYEKDSLDLMNNKNHFSGTSFSVAYFFSKYMNKCANNFVMTHFASCLMDHLKKITDDIIVFE